MGSQNKDGETQIKFYKKWSNIQTTSQKVAFIPSRSRTLSFSFCIHKEGPDFFPFIYV